MASLTNTREVEERLQFATEIAREAGKRLLALRNSGRWTDPDVLGDVADQAADGFLQGFVRGRYPGDGLLSEETADDHARLQKELTWIVDPLDGTNEYRTGRHDWAVHVGLSAGGGAALGAVAMPSIACVVAGVALPGSERVTVHGEHELARDKGPSSDKKLRLAVSRSHTPSWIRTFAQALGPHEFVPSGSVGFKVGLLLFGQADVYVHKIGLKEWDTCAPEVLARAAGWSVCRMDGTPHRYNAPDPKNGEIVVCRPWLLDRVLGALDHRDPAR
jgi:3'(2'), 5'-bisphosphate nucleotidase